MATEQTSFLGFSSGGSGVVACKVCSGLLFLVYAITGTIFLAAGEGAPVRFDASVALRGVVTETTTDYRTAPPLAAFLGEVAIFNAPVLATVDIFNVLWIAVAALYFSAIWLCCLPAGFYFFGGADSGYMKTLDQDFNWYRWVHWSITHPLWFVVVTLVAGATNVFVITLVAFVVVAWVTFLAFNEGAAKVPATSLAGVRGGSVINVASRFFEAFLCTIVLFVVVAAVYFSYAATSAVAATAAPIVWSTTASAFILYFGFLCCGVAAHTYAGVWKGGAKELCYECWYFIFVTVVFWVVTGFALSYVDPGP